VALRRAGISSTVYERAPAFAEIGAGLSLWPNATRILKAWGLLEPLLAEGEVAEGFELRGPKGGRVAAFGFGKFSTPAVCVHRADLHRVLRGQVPEDRLVPHARLVSFSQSAGGIDAEFAGGRRAAGGGLIGADGIHSAVRGQLRGAAPPSYRGYGIWRGLAPNPGTPPGKLIEFWGPGRRFGIMPIGRKRVCWYATRNEPPGRPDRPESRKAEMRELFRGWDDMVLDLIEATESALIVKVGAMDRPALRKWGEGRVTLLGDAAHPITPNVGQGACLAIEDAACLAKALGEQDEVAAAFRSYEARRRRRTASIARRARLIGAVGQMEGRAVAVVRAWIVRLALALGGGGMSAIHRYEA